MKYVTVAMNYSNTNLATLSKQLNQRSSQQKHFQQSVRPKIQNKYSLKKIKYNNK